MQHSVPFQHPATSSTFGSISSPFSSVPIATRRSNLCNAPITCNPSWPASIHSPRKPSESPHHFSPRLNSLSSPLSSGPGFKSLAPLVSHPIGENIIPFRNSFKTHSAATAPIGYEAPFSPPGRAPSAYTAPFSSFCLPLRPVKSIRLSRVSYLTTRSSGLDDSVCLDDSHVSCDFPESPGQRLMSLVKSKLSSREDVNDPGNEFITDIQIGEYCYFIEAGTSDERLKVHLVDDSMGWVSWRDNDKRAFIICARQV